MLHYFPDVFCDFLFSSICWIFLYIALCKKCFQCSCLVIVFDLE